MKNLYKQNACGMWPHDRALQVKNVFRSRALWMKPEAIALGVNCFFQIWYTCQLKLSHHCHIRWCDVRGLMEIWGHGRSSLKKFLSDPMDGEGRRFLTTFWYCQRQQVRGHGPEASFLPSGKPTWQNRSDNWNIFGKLVALGRVYIKYLHVFDSDDRPLFSRTRFPETKHLYRPFFTQSICHLVCLSIKSGAFFQSIAQICAAHVWLRLSLLRSDLAQFGVVRCDLDAKLILFGSFSFQNDRRKVAGGEAKASGPGCRLNGSSLRSTTNGLQHFSVQVAQKRAVPRSDVVQNGTHRKHRSTHPERNRRWEQESREGYGLEWTWQRGTGEWN